METIGVLLLAFGGPDSPEAIEPFLADVIGRPPSPQLLAATVEKYMAVGGRSPLPAAAQSLSRQLEERLNGGAAASGAGGTAAGSARFCVYVGMRHWHPFIAEAVQRLADDGIRQAVAVSLSPYDSQVTTGAFRRLVAEGVERAAAAARAVGNGGGALQVRFAPTWYNHPRFRQALEERLREGLQQFAERPARGPEAGAPDVPVIFTAHSLPVKYIEQGDPYRDQLLDTAQALARRVGVPSWQLAWQSRGAAHMEWLAPQVEEVIDQLAAAGHRHVLIDPIGFVIDHMETLYDIDIALRAHAAKLGVHLRRCACPNEMPALLEALVEIVHATLSAEPAGGGASA